MTGTPTEGDFAGENDAPRSLRLTLDLTKIPATGITPCDQDEALQAHLAE